MPTEMPTIEMTKLAESVASLPVAVPVSPIIVVELAHGHVRLHCADTTMLATAFNLLSAATLKNVDRKSVSK
jgi:hypothetical protein